MGGRIGTNIAEPSSGQGDVFQPWWPGSECMWRTTSAFFMRAKLLCGQLLCFEVLFVHCCVSSCVLSTAPPQFLLRYGGWLGFLLGSCV